MVTNMHRNTWHGHVSFPAVKKLAHSLIGNSHCVLKTFCVCFQISNSRSISPVKLLALLWSVRQISAHVALITEELLCASSIFILEVCEEKIIRFPCGSGSVNTITSGVSQRLPWPCNNVHQWSEQVSYIFGYLHNFTFYISKSSDWPTK